MIVLWRTLFTLILAISFGLWMNSIWAGIFMFMIPVTYKQLED